MERACPGRPSGFVTPIASGAVSGAVGAVGATNMAFADLAMSVAFCQRPFFLLASFGAAADFARAVARTGAVGGNSWVFFEGTEGRRTAGSLELRITAAFTVDGSKDWLRAMLRVTLLG